MVKVDPGPQGQLSAIEIAAGQGKTVATAPVTIAAQLPGAEEKQVAEDPGFLTVEQRFSPEELAFFNKWYGDAERIKQGREAEAHVLAYYQYRVDSAKPGYVGEREGVYHSPLDAQGVSDQFGPSSYTSLNLDNPQERALYQPDAGKKYVPRPSAGTFGAWSYRYWSPATPAVNRAAFIDADNEETWTQDSLRCAVSGKGGYYGKDQQTSIAEVLDEFADYLVDKVRAHYLTKQQAKGLMVKLVAESALEVYDMGLSSIPKAATGKAQDEALVKFDRRLSRI